MHVVSKNNNKYYLIIEFYGYIPSINNVILISNELLEDIKISLVSFGILNDYKGRNIDTINDNDLLKK